MTAAAVFFLVKLTWILAKEGISPFSKGKYSTKLLPNPPGGIINMKQWNVYNYSKQKARGLRRKCRTFSRYINEHTESLTNIGGSHLWLYFHKFFGDTPKVPNSVRKFFVQTIINRAKHLISLKTEAEKEIRVICVFTLPELYKTLILIPPTQSAYERFFDGFFSAEKYGRTAIPLYQDYFESEWGFIIPQGLDVRGYKLMLMKMTIVLKKRYGLSENYSKQLMG